MAPISRGAKSVAAIATCTLLFACKPPPTDESVGRGEIIEIVSGPSDPITSPNTENAIWANSTSREGRIIYGNIGEAPLLALTCEDDGANPVVRITRFVAADEGAGALLALIGNGHRSRLKVDATPAGEAFLWEGEIAADDPQLEVLTGKRSVTATLPGAGMLTLNVSNLPSELVENCRGDEELTFPEEAELDLPLSDEPSQ